MKKVILSFLFLVTSCSLMAQVSEGGFPPSFTQKTKSTPKELIPYEARLKTNIDSLRIEDAKLDGKNVPQRVASIIPSNINLAEAGEWIELANGQRICRLTIDAPNALGIILSYSQFIIPKGGKLFIYGEDRTQVLGAYTYRTNPKRKSFSTEIVYGDRLTLEYVDANTSEKPQIIIEGIGYGYNSIFDSKKANVAGEGFNASGDCQVNINCPEGDNWQDQKKGVARSYTRIGSSWNRCSGSLINNANEDRTAFYLSAYHCFYTTSGYEADFDQTQFYFNYEFESCEESNIKPEAQSIVGAQLLVVNPVVGGSDGILLKLDEEIPEDYDVYFNGWNASNTPATSGVSIHHPQGDVKKISTYTTTLGTGTFADAAGSSLPNVHWIVKYAATVSGHGTTEQGSSGSPLFDQNKLIVGTLTGGGSSCSSKNGVDYYSKFGFNWDQDSNTALRMKAYLDPGNKNITKLVGLSNIKVNPPIELEGSAPVQGFWKDRSARSALLLVLKENTDVLKRVRIVNFRGYDVYNKTDLFISNSYEVNTQAWVSGLYIVTVETQNAGTYSFKLFK